MVLFNLSLGPPLSKRSHNGHLPFLFLNPSFLCGAGSGIAYISWQDFWWVEVIHSNDCKIIVFSLIIIVL
jgi:hypothetical protein